MPTYISDYRRTFGGDNSGAELDPVAVATDDTARAEYLQQVPFGD